MTRIARLFTLTLLATFASAALAAGEVTVEPLQSAVTDPTEAQASVAVEAAADDEVAEAEVAETEVADAAETEVAEAEAAADEPAVEAPAASEEVAVDDETAAQAVAEAGDDEQAPVDAAVAEAAPAVEAPEPKLLDQEMEDIKKALVGLKRDLVILEEDLLFPASSQVSVFLSLDVGEFFALDAVTLKVNGKEVTHHLYTRKQVDALLRGGVQKLFVGNVKQGNNRVTAFFTGTGKEGRDFRRATTVDFEKGFEPTFIELAITDETADYQPDFSAAVVN